MLNLEKMIHQRDMFRARVELMRMLTELSDEALKYAWRPIAYAWHYTDGNDPDVMTDDDLDRMCLAGAVAHGDIRLVARTCQLYRFLQNDEPKRRRAAK